MAATHDDSDQPAGDASATVDVRLDALVDAIFAAGNADLRTEDEALVRCERVATYRNVARVLAPRLALEPGLLVTGWCTLPDPWSVTMRVAEVEPFSASAESVVLEAVESSLYPDRRRVQRFDIGGEAVVTIHHGVEMVEQERFRAVLVNASAGGIAFASSAGIAVGRHLTLDARLLLGRLQADLVVRWCGPSQIDEMRQYGCELTDPAAVAGLLERMAHQRPPQHGDTAAVAALRESLDTPRGFARLWRSS
ncbi:MAG TPA: PilZ domain-containing protein [Gaiellales bacterium]|jgi:hypothetical protein